MGGIKPEDLVDRRVYHIQSRNLLVGAWNAPTKGFIGVREKLGSRYLFTEYEWDLVGAPLGTARAVEDLGIDVPAEIAMAEYLGTVCSGELRPVEFDPTAENPERRVGQNKGAWVHLDDRSVLATTCQYPMQWHNRELFELLEPLDLAAAEEHRRQDAIDYERRAKEPRRDTT